MSYDDYDYRKPPSGDTGKILLIVFGILGAVVLGCAGVGLVFYFAIATLGRNASGTFTFVATKASASGPMTVEGKVRGGATPEATAKEFFDLIKVGQLDSAYELTTPHFRRRTGLDAFRQAVNQLPALQQQPTSQRYECTTSNGRSTYTRTVGGPTGNATVRLRLVQENGQWQIDEFTPQ